MVMLLESQVEAEGEGPDARIARIVPAKLEIARAAGARFGIVPAVLRPGDEILPAGVEPQAAQIGARREPLRHVPTERDVLEPDEGAVLHPPRGHRAERTDPDPGHLVRRIRRRP